jgi:hypothetical protein
MTEWRTRDGRSIPVNHMTERHLTHSIAKMERDRWRLDRLSELKEELTRRKHAAPTPEEIFARTIGEAEDAMWREENASEEDKKN